MDVASSTVNCPAEATKGDRRPHDAVPDMTTLAGRLQTTPVGFADRRAIRAHCYETSMEGNTMKKMIALVLLLAAPALVSAAPPRGAATRGDGAGGCGWGSYLFNGNSGVGAHVLAVTTNGSFGNNTFGLSSGTNGCDANQPIKYKGGQIYISANMTKLAEDMSRGRGETLAGLAETLGIADQDKPIFYSRLKDNFAVIYPHESVTGAEAMNALVVVMKSDPALAKYVS
jgi:hypothetical protein